MKWSLYLPLLWGELTKFAVFSFDWKYCCSHRHFHRPAITDSRWRLFYALYINCFGLLTGSFFLLSAGKQESSLIVPALNLFVKCVNYHCAIGLNLFAERNTSFALSSIIFFKTSFAQTELHFEKQDSTINWILPTVCFLCIFI